MFQVGPGLDIAIEEPGKRRLERAKERDPRWTDENNRDQICNRVSECMIGFSRSVMLVQDVGKIILCNLLEFISIVDFYLFMFILFQSLLNFS